MKSCWTCTSLLAACCVAVGVLLAAATESSAQFVQTGLNLFQHVDLENRVLISRQVPGLFVSKGPTTKPEHFDPRKLTQRTSLDVFLEFDPDSLRCISIWVRSKKYTIHGNAILTMGDLRISIDNSLPLVTITDGPGDSVLGFSGSKLVFNKMGVREVRLLEANQVGSIAIAMHYTVVADGLLHQGAAASSQDIGVTVELRYPDCFMRPEAFYLWESDIDGLRAIKNRRQRRSKLRLLKEQNPFNQIMSDAIPINVKEDEALLYRPDEDKIIAAECRRSYVLLAER